jgi:flavin reductase (DIM6/NTAB) family NADH-FMN oxidoreductase RutF
VKALNVTVKAGHENFSQKELLMKNRIELNFWEYSNEILNRMREEGVLCTVTDKASNNNIITLGWGQIGPFYHDHPVFIIAIAPQRYSWHFLEEMPEFVIGVPDDSLRKAVEICGTLSGRDVDKFQAAGLTPAKSKYVSAPSILECPINIECRVYTTVIPPHLLLTPEHRKAPVGCQHTIYFAEVLGTFGWEPDNSL